MEAMTQNEHEAETECQPVEPNEPAESDEFQKEVQRLIKNRKKARKTTAKKKPALKSECEDETPLPLGKENSIIPSNPPINDQKQQKPRENVKSSIGLVVLIVATSVLMLSLFHRPVEMDIHIDKMMEWIDKGPGEQHFIEVVEGTGSSEMTVRYSNLDRRLVVKEYVIRGTATRQVLKTAKKTDPQKEIPKFPVSSGRRAFPDTDGKLRERLFASGFEIHSVGYPNFFQEHGIWLLMFACFLGLTFFLIRGIGNSGAMAFGRNRGRLVAQEEIDIKFENVAGVDEAVEELKEIVEFRQTS